MSTKDKIKDLEKRIKELESKPPQQPIIIINPAPYPYPVVVPYPYPVNPWPVYPNPIWITYQPNTLPPVPNSMEPSSPVHDQTVWISSSNVCGPGASGHFQ